MDMKWHKDATILKSEGRVPTWNHEIASLRSQNDNDNSEGREGTKMWAVDGSCLRNLQFPEILEHRENQK